jgi:hypothetical protein
MTGQDTSQPNGNARARSTTLVTPISAATDNTLIRVMYCEVFPLSNRHVPPIKLEIRPLSKDTCAAVFPDKEVATTYSNKIPSLNKRASSGKHGSIYLISTSTNFEHSLPMQARLSSMQSNCPVVSRIDLLHDVGMGFFHDNMQIPIKSCSLTCHHLSTMS